MLAESRRAGSAAVTLILNFVEHRFGTCRVHHAKRLHSKFVLLNDIRLLLHWLLFVAIKTHVHQLILRGKFLHFHAALIKNEVVRMLRH